MGGVVPDPGFHPGLDSPAPLGRDFAVWTAFEAGPRPHSGLDENLDRVTPQCVRGARNCSDLSC
jgi:hypothetical protein